MAVSDVPSLMSHCQAKVAPLRPSASAIPSDKALSVSPTRAVPPIVGRPVGAALTESGPGTLTSTPPESRRPSFAHTAPVSSHGRFPARTTVTVPCVSGRTWTSQTLFDGRFRRRDRNTVPSVARSATSRRVR